MTDELDSWMRVQSVGEAPAPYSRRYESKSPDTARPLTVTTPLTVAFQAGDEIVTGMFSGELRSDGASGEAEPSRHVQRRRALGIRQSGGQDQEGPILNELRRRRLRRQQPVADVDLSGCHQSSFSFGSASATHRSSVVRPQYSLGNLYEGTHTAAFTTPRRLLELQRRLPSRAASMKSRIARQEIEVLRMFTIGELSALPAQTPTTRFGV